MLSILAILLGYLAILFLGSVGIGILFSMIWGEFSIVMTPTGRYFMSLIGSIITLMALYAFIAFTQFVTG